MKRVLILSAWAICALALLNCIGSNNSNYVVINNTDSKVGFVVYYEKVKTIVEPYRRFEHYERVNGVDPGAPIYKLSNLYDTTSIIIDAQKSIMIRENVLETEIDTILYNAYSCYGRYTYQWVVTDELLSIMTHDETLLAEFPDFYKK